MALCSFFCVKFNQLMLSAVQSQYFFLFSKKAMHRQGLLLVSLSSRPMLFHCSQDRIPTFAMPSEYVIPTNREPCNN
jgi:hypothetical protein